MLPHSLQLLIPAKLTAPRPLDSWIARERLVAALDEATVPLVLVVAPAGFGKSTLVAQWIARAATSPASAYEGGPPRPTAWLALDEHDQDVLRFLAYVVRAVEGAAGVALSGTRQLLETPQPPPAHVVAQTLLAELNELPAGVGLIFDDYHLVTEREIHQTVAYLLRHLPPACRLVLLSRTDPPLPLARLRAERQVLELRAADLRFTADEVGELLRASGSAAPDAALVAALHEQTEGWAIALQLATLVQTSVQTLDQLPRAASRQIAEYLADEVLALQPPARQQTLLALAVPDRFCAELYAALLDAPEEIIQAESRLDDLVRGNMFVIPLDQEGRWYRFHHLFRDLLLRRLHLTMPAGAVRALQRHAADWLGRAGLVEEAVRLYLSAGDEEAATDLVECQLLPELSKDVSSVPPGYWLRLLPERLATRRPGLALLVARLSVFSMDMSDFQARIEHIDTLLADPETASRAALWPSFAADLLVLRGILCYWRGRPAETIRHIQAALERGPTSALVVQSILQLGLSYVGSGAYAEGLRVIEDGPPEVRARLGQGYDLVRQTCLSFMHLVAGELAAHQQSARQLAALVEVRHPGALWEGYAATHLSLAAYERSDLAAAERHFAVLIARKYRISYPGYMGGVVGLALLAAARGAFEEADELAHEAEAFAEEAGGVFLRHQALGCRVRLALARGDVAAAVQSADRIDRDVHLGLAVWLEIPRLSQAQAYIASGAPHRLEQADAILASCLAEIEPSQNTRLLIRALLLLALLRQAQGRRAEALAAAERAVRLAEPHGFVRTLLDVGPAIQPLLHDLAARGVASAYLTTILGAPRPPVAPPPRPAVDDDHLVFAEPLTPREAEVLALLAERWSNQEIADQLVVTVNTVRKHTSTIYDKLGVASRREAVAAARSLGILPVH